MGSRLGVASGKRDVACDRVRSTNGKDIQRVCCELIAFGFVDRIPPDRMLARLKPTLVA
jgi:hypothetical protein